MDQNTLDYLMQTQQMSRAGRTYVAPSPFEGLAQLGQAYMARKGGQKAYAKEEELADRRMEKIKAYEDTLRGRLRPLLPVDPDDDEEKPYNPYFMGSSRSV